MHAPQAVAAQAPPPEERTEHQQARAGLAEHVAEARRESARTEAVDQQVRAHATRRGARERVGDQAAGFIVGEDVALEEYFLSRRIERRNQRRKILNAIFQERQAVAADVLHAGPSSASARR